MIIKVRTCRICRTLATHTHGHDYSCGYLVNRDAYYPSFRISKEPQAAASI